MAAKLGMQFRLQNDWWTQKNNYHAAAAGGNIRVLASEKMTVSHNKLGLQ